MMMNTFTDGNINGKCNNDSINIPVHNKNEYHEQGVDQEISKANVVSEVCQLYSEPLPLGDSFNWVSISTRIQVQTDQVLKLKNTNAWMNVYIS